MAERVQVGAQAAAVGKDTWGTAAFRQRVRTEIEDAIRKCPEHIKKNGVQIEAAIFEQAHERTEYLCLSSRFIIHLREKGMRGDVEHLAEVHKMFRESQESQE